VALVSVCSCSSFHTAHCIVSPCSENNKTISKHTDVILRSCRLRQALSQQQKNVKENVVKKKEKNVTKNNVIKTENRSVLKKSQFGFGPFGSVFRFKTEPAASLLHADQSDFDVNISKDVLQ